MRTSRRSLIKLGLYASASFVTFCDGLSGRVALAAALNQAPTTGDDVWLRRDMFEACVGQSFALRRPGSVSIALRLMRVEDALSARNAGTVNDPNCFTVLFRGPRAPRLEQGTYRVQSRSLGTFELFLVPGAPQASGVIYAATFNRAGAV